MLDGELLYTIILEVNLFAFAYRLFHEDFSPIYLALVIFLASKQQSNQSKPVVLCITM